MEIEYNKQTHLFNVNKPQKRVIIYGIGSIGSHVAIGLAKTGIKDITVIDYDTVENGNIPAQFYRIKDIGKNKTTAIMEQIIEYIGTKIDTIQQKITKENLQIPLTQNTIHVIAVDDIDTRKLIVETLQQINTEIIDARIGGNNYEIYYTKTINEAGLKNYKETLEGTFTEDKCGEKCMWGINSHVSSRIIQRILLLNKEGKKVPKGYFGDYEVDNGIVTKD